MEICEEMFLQYEHDLLQFDWDCQKFYGKSFIKFNVHILLHLVKSVRLNGPLWATSTFWFASNIAYFKSKVLRPRAVMEQIARKTLQHNELKFRLENLKLNKVRVIFCRSLFERNHLDPENIVKSVEGAVLFGDEKQKEQSQFQKCIYNRV